MMFNPGDGVILLGDATTHGGRVISGQARYQVNGKPVAVVGDKVSCPKKGHGVCSIVEGHPTITLDGIPVAFHGCHTSCGAKLISASGGRHGLV
ncbi:PAAR domain-containing protein [Halomonas mongoliensis]|uniref:PAAR domain-containing protein n=1 Tax=Halomonas mongoliensis TaxID=321265 RepID=UPI00403A849E